MEIEMADNEGVENKMNKREEGGEPSFMNG